MSTPTPRRLIAGVGTAIALVAGAFAGIGAAAAPPAAPPLVISVSPSGHGDACITRDPCSLTEGQARARTLARAARSDIDVVLAGGTYHLDHTLAFDAAKGDSAPAGRTVSYEAAPGQSPVLSGGEQVSGWQQGANGIWSAKVPAGTDTRQLYVNGVRENRASGKIPDSFTRTATGYTTSGTTMDSWQNISDVEFVYNVAWTQMRCRVASVSGTTVTMQEPCFQNSTLKQYGANANNPDLIENAKALLDEPGEWYLDQPTHTIYYMPKAGENLRTADVEIPKLQTLVSGTGTVQRPLTGLTLSGLSFEYGGWTAPDGPDGFSEVQANMRLTGNDAYAKEGSCTRFSTTDPGTCPYGAWTMTPGNVTFAYTSHLTIENSTFEHLGAAGLELGRDVNHSTIKGNVVTDTSANGIEVGNGTDATPSDLALIPSYNDIADNWVHNVAAQYTGGVGIFQGYALHDTIEHNQVNDVPYSGISSNWGWGHQGSDGGYNTISDNLIFDHMQQRSDGGGIYVLGVEGQSMASGLTISGNVVRNGNSADGGHAIYTDGGSEYITMTGNAMFDNGVFSMGGCYEGAGTPYGDFDFTGNYVENPNPDWVCGNPTDLTLNNTQVSSDGTGVPASVIDNAGLEAPYQHLAAAPTGVAPVNLAAGKPAQAQFLDGTTAQLQPESQLTYATDGDPSTYIQASGQFRWQLVVDLQKQQQLGYLTVGMPQKHFATAFHVDASADGQNWKTVSTITDSGWGTIPVVFSSPVSARYVRIVADEPDNGGQRGDQMAIDEVGAFAATPGNADLALDKPAQALFIDGTLAAMQPNETPALAVDGDPGTWAQATGQYRWVQQVDLGSEQSFQSLSLLQPDDKFATAWHVDVSQDGSTFYTVARHDDTAGGLSGVQFDRPVKARYVRIVADTPNGGGQNGGQMAVSELGIYRG
ncbi:discoidin domain-containing protein [Gryllotalpicola reticulitermitis]|uniref:Discoidin domain-containing protein n=1 Tax=Gryllotalpicola reticulitermitis TaxID=1184153 RepID=A0ABV8QBZ7_9MICO